MPINVLRADAVLRAFARRGWRTPAPSSTVADVAEAMTWPNIIGLGEMMNFPGRRRQRSEDARRDRRDACGPARRSAGTTPRPTSACLPRLCRRRAGGRPRGHARGGRDRARAPGHEGDAAAGLGLVRRRRADQGGDRERARSAQLHPVHRRLPFRHAGARRPYGPRGAARHRAGAEAGRRRSRWRRSTPRSISGWSASSARSRRAGWPI